jgi:hypothetical protein
LTLAALDLSSQTNPRVDIYLVESVDGGTDFENGADANSTDALHPPASNILVSVALRPGSGSEAKLAIESMLPIPPGRFKIYLVNETGVAFASSGNTLAYRTYGLSSA